MGYAIYQMNGRDCGYSVPAVCEQPGCNEEIDRGFAYCCGGYPDSEYGCHLYFCGKHMYYYNSDPKDDDSETVQLCDVCSYNNEHANQTGDPDQYREPHPKKPDVLKWVVWKLLHESWDTWRKENPDELRKYWLQFDSVRLTELEPVLKELAEWGLFEKEDSTDAVTELHE